MRYTKEYLEEKYSPEQLDEFIGTALKWAGGIAKDAVKGLVKGAMDDFGKMAGVPQSGFAGKDADRTTQDTEKVMGGVGNIKRRTASALANTKIGQKLRRSGLLSDPKIPTVKIAGHSDFEKEAKERRKKKK